MPPDQSIHSGDDAEGTTMTNDRTSTETATLRAALEAAYRELKLHDAEYHHRTPVEVNNMIVDALGKARTSPVSGLAELAALVRHHIVLNRFDILDDESVIIDAAGLELTLSEALAKMCGVAQSPDLWRPIETAPKDGSFILTYTPGHVQDTMAWSESDKEWRNGYDDRAQYPTHWMSLPQGPDTSTVRQMNEDGK